MTTSEQLQQWRELADNRVAHRAVGGHWLMFESEPGGEMLVIAGCHCGFTADMDGDSGYGDSVIDHIEAVIRAEEAAERDRLADEVQWLRQILERVRGHSRAVRYVVEFAETEGDDQ